MNCKYTYPKIFDKKDVEFMYVFFDIKSKRDK